ncbi:MAG TPA: DMT family transporter [Ktedonobacterales bacterium]|nr:DMT family transporter [Ktedonobacterales bacterium]
MNSDPRTPDPSAVPTTGWRSVAPPRRGAGESARPPGNPRVGYYFAVLNAIISGVAIYVNSIGVKLFADSTLYTALKNAVVGIAVLLPLIVLADSRRELRGLRAKEWGLLAVVALIGGSVAYALDFRGLQLSTAVTAALIDHVQFLFVAVFAAILLRERFGPWIWLALVVLFLGLSLGISVNAVRWDTGVIFLGAATLLFALDFVVIKYLLRSVSMLTVMLFKMSLGAALLLAYLAVLGRLGAIRHLSGTQWGFVLVTGLILLAFTITSIAGLRHASATAVIAIGAGSPIITTLLVLFARHTPLDPAKLFGLGLILAALLVIFTFGRRQEIRRSQAQAENMALMTGQGFHA